MIEKRKNQFIEMEEEVVDFWDKNSIFQKTLDKEAPQGDYVFYDGPPFATGTPHYGHLVASIMKDVVPRFWTMRGYHVDRKWGWDCHGLPIENIVEKEMGSESKKDIEENIGVEKFNETCRTKVLSYVDEWKKTIRRLGRFVDMENSYKTMDMSFMESVWNVFKELWDKDLVYKDYRSMHICPRCETTLSQSEVTEGYKDIKDLSATAKFELVDEPGTFVLAWTTTPWTLPGNVALAVGEDIDYVEVEMSGSLNAFEKKPGQEVVVQPRSEESEKYILAKERIVDVLKDKEYEIVKEFKGSELVGKKYKPLFNAYANQADLENKDNGWKIYNGDFVTTEEGTGVVHIAPAFGEDDMNLGKEHNLPFVQHVEMNGNFKKEMGELAYLNVKPKDDVMSTDVEIIKYLAHNNLLFAKAKYEHSYPHCWRCDTPLINYATSSWFINVKKLKGETDKKIAGKTLLDTAQDINWSPAHIKEGRFGKWLEGARDWSISRQRFWASCIPIWECTCGERKVIGSVKGLEDLVGKKIKDLHKHTLDKITFKCDKCSGEMKRIPDVFDCWFESGSMPYASIHYPFENKEKFDNSFPAEFIAEGADQTRAWFYYLHVIAGGLKNRHAFKNVIVNGIVLAEDGKKMSKKLKNYPDPMHIFDTYGADPLRYYLLTSPVMLADNLNFSEKGVSEYLRKLNNILWNTYKFYEMYADSQLRIENYELRTDDLNNVLDKWIVARFNQLIGEVTEGMEKYNLPKATRPIVEFIDDLSTWYLRRSRDRFKGNDEQDKQDALKTFGFVLLELSKVMAPFTPFIAEQLYQKVTGYNFADKNKSVHLEEWSRAEKTDNDVLINMEKIRRIVEMALAKRDEAGIKVRQTLSQLKIKNEKLKNEYLELIKDEVNVKEVVCEEGDGELSLELNIELNIELIAEGVAREVVRFINSMRKQNDLTIEDRIEIFYKAEGDIKNAIETWKEQIIKDTLADSISEGTSEITKEVKINRETIILSIKKL